MSNDTYTHVGPPREVKATFWDKTFISHGGESYAIPIFTFDDEAGGIKPIDESGPRDSDGLRPPTHHVIKFLRGHKDKAERQNGILSEHLLEMLIERHERLNAEVPSWEGEMVLSNLRAALHALTYRAVDRSRRNVLNTGKS